MESIRPDQDELRAKNPKSRSESGKTTTKAGNGDARPPVMPARDKGRANKKGPGTGFLAFLLVVVVAAGCLGWYTQAKRIDRLSNKLQEADYWVRQSKLALARFEGDLSETGENLKERGSSLEGRIGGLEKQAKTANSEIRKLWAVANERNKKAINANQEAVSGLQKSVNEVRHNASDLSAKQEADSTRLEELASRQANQSDTLKSLADTLDTQTGKVAGLSESLTSAKAAVSDLESQVASAKKSRSQLEASANERLDRVRQEQTLALNEMGARLSRLEKTSGNAGKINSVEQRLKQVEGAIRAIDAARAQLNARLIRLGQEVDTLRSGG